jgi:hypothetical protein
VVTNVLEEFIASIFKVQVSQVGMWLGIQGKCGQWEWGKKKEKKKGPEKGNFQGRLCTYHRQGNKQVEVLGSVHGQYKQLHNIPSIITIINFKAYKNLRI